MKPYRKGLVAVSADPITYGHIDLIRRSSEQCESLLVLVANNDLKAGAYLFPLNERVDITKEALRQAGLEEVQVLGTDGLLVDVYLREGCDVLFRGIRNQTDRIYEQEQMAYHIHILPELASRIVFLEATETLRIVSSSLAKAFVRSGVDVSDFVPIFVKRLLEERLLGQFRLGITGVQASGKTFVSQQIIQEMEKRGVSATAVNVDELLRRLYDEDSAGAQRVRGTLAEWFGQDVLTAEGKSVQRDILKQRIFDVKCDPRLREALHQLVAPHIGRLFREALRGKHGLILVEWAQMAEMNLSHWTNHDVVVVESDDMALFRNARGLSEEASAVVATHQWSAQRKVEALYERAEAAGSGMVVRYGNRATGNPNGAQPLLGVIETLFPKLSEKRGEA